MRRRAVNEALREIPGREQRIDVLEVDSEGSEVDLVNSIDERLVERFATIFFESRTHQPLHPDRYDLRFTSLTNRLTERAT